MSNYQQLNNLIDYCRNYTEYKSYVYNLLADSYSWTDRRKKWLVIMKKLDSTKTNEDDTDIIEHESAQFVQMNSS